MTGAAKMLLVASKQGGMRDGEARGEMRGEGRGEMRGEYRADMRGEGRGNMRGEMRGEYRAEMRGYGGGEMRQHYPMYPYIPPYGNEPEDEMRDEMRGGYDDMENRYRRRYKNGRFAPRSEMEMGSDGGSRRGKERSGNRQPMQIGFRAEEEPGRYRADGSYLRMIESGHKTSRMEKGGAESKTEKMDEETAEEWTSKMKNADGTTGAHWKMEQVEQVLQQRNIDCDPVEFFVTMNMMYSDYSKVARAHGVNKVEFYADMAKAFLDDKDAGENKLMTYYECIVE